MPNWLEDSKQWSPVPGYEGTYSVSSDGEIRRDAAYRNTRSGRILKPSHDNYGYSLVHLSALNKVKTFAVHRIVAEAFLGPRPAGKQVNHIDGDKSHNAISNLEYCTPQENIKHAYKTGLIVAPSGQNHYAYGTHPVRSLPGKPHTPEERLQISERFRGNQFRKGKKLTAAHADALHDGYRRWREGGAK